MGVGDAERDPYRVAGRRLGGAQLSGQIADRLVDGETLTAALNVVHAGRRAHIRSLMEERQDVVRIAVLRAIEGARSTPTAISPLWTMPGHLVRGGPLISSIRHTVDGARQSITCSTYNFQRSSTLWTALWRAAQRPELALRVYLDTAAADQHPNHWAPTSFEVAEHLRPGTVLRTKEFDGVRVRNHAKFLAIDYRFLLVTSANFSWSAEHGNVEFGVLIDDRNLTEAVEREMLEAEDLLYELCS